MTDHATGTLAQPRIDAETLRAVLTSFRDALAAHRAAINDLNVYPVPDGDTGTNMALTMASVVEAVAAAGPSMAETCEALAHGALMGARGNSGVILSQVLRGIAEVFAPVEEADAATFARALEAASIAAYAAVMRPVEGTILTVVRAAADAAVELTAEGTATGASLIEVVDAAHGAATLALAHTPDLLPVLAQAGVVDAGGTGFMLLLDAARYVLDDRPMPQPIARPATVGTASPTARDLHAATEVNRYEVMYFLHTAEDRDVTSFREAWSQLGDSIVVVGGKGIWNCHIHTDDIGGAIEAGIAVGTPAKIRVTDLREEVLESEWVQDALEPGLPAPSAVEPVTTAVVAVGAGSGVLKLFRSLGVHEVVTGGQSMNPSTAELLAAVEACPAQGVVILPNNKNIIPVALQVDALTEKTVRVVPTRAITQGLAALVAYDPEDDAEHNLSAMVDASHAVAAGEVTQAVRDAQTDVGPVRAGDWLGIDTGGIVAIGPSLVETTAALLDLLVTDEHEIVTLVVGEDVDEATTAEVEAWLEANRPEVEVEVHHGGQPLYAYFIGSE